MDLDRHDFELDELLEGYMDLSESEIAALLPAYDLSEGEFEHSMSRGGGSNYNKLMNKINQSGGINPLWTAPPPAAPPACCAPRSPTGSAQAAPSSLSSGRLAKPTMTPAISRKTRR